MTAGLTKSSRELASIQHDDPKSFREALEYGVRSYEHYKNLISLLNSAIFRLYSVTRNAPLDNLEKDFKDLDARILKILAENPDNQESYDQ